MWTLAGTSSGGPTKHVGSGDKMLRGERPWAHNWYRTAVFIKCVHGINAQPKPLQLWLSPGKRGHSRIMWTVCHKKDKTSPNCPRWTGPSLNAGLDGTGHLLPFAKVGQQRRNNNNFFIISSLRSVKYFDSLIKPPSHLHVKLSRRSYARKFARNGVGCGYLVAVTGSTWLLWGLWGAY